jgi:hypothetical protein
VFKHACGVHMHMGLAQPGHSLSSYVLVLHQHVTLRLTPAGVLQWLWLRPGLVKVFGVTVSLWYAAGLWGGSISTWWDMPESFDISQPGPDNPQAVLGDIHVDVQPSMRPDSSAVLAHALLWFPGLTAGREASLRLDTPPPLCA